MGIRIHKVLGYGLVDLEYDEEDWKSTDPRFNHNGYFGMDVYEQEDNYSDTGFDEHISKIIDDSGDKCHELKILWAARKDALEGRKSYKYEDSIDHCITRCTEFGDASVVVFTPPYWGKSWSRYDNIIDYYDPAHHNAQDGGIDDGYVMLDRPIYPFESYSDCRTTPPKRVDNSDQQLFRDARNEGMYQQDYIRAALKSMNFSSMTEMQEYIRPIIPLELVVLLKYLKVFNDEKDIYTLKPMLYWYWG